MDIDAVRMRITEINRAVTAITRLLDDYPQQPKSESKHAESARRVLAFLNAKSGKAYRPVAANLSLIISRMDEGATEDECRQVIVRKCRDWKDDEKMALYLRPATLFNRTKFAQYSGELVI